MQKWRAEAGLYLQVKGLLSAVEAIIGNEMLQNLAAKYHATPQVLFLRFVMGHGVVPLLGQFRNELVKDTVEAWRIPLTVQDAEIIDELLKQQRQQQGIVAELVQLNDAMDLNMLAENRTKVAQLRDQIQEREVSNPVSALRWRQQHQVQK